jgi:cation transporter-like permease
MPYADMPGAKRGSGPGGRRRDRPTAGENFLKSAIFAFAILATGPVLAVLTLTAGCFLGSRPLLGDMCGRNAPITLLVMLGFWFVVIAIAVAAYRARPRARRTLGPRASPSPPSVRRRAREPRRK